jgi:uncharacterized protein
MNRTILQFALFFCLAFSAVGALPPVPSNGGMISDFASVIDSGNAARIERQQNTTLKQHGTPIVVVTIRRMSEYDGSNPDIKDFAREWFNHWQIGTLRAVQNPANKGILLLVSTQDRKARIELGADWGRKWDAECQRIMNESIVPRFKKSDYPGGIANGVDELARIAALGPRATPPGETLLERTSNTIDSSEPIREIRAMNPYSTDVSTIMIVGGIALLVAGIFMPDYRKPLMIVGAILIVAGISIILIFTILGAFSKSGGSSRSSSGGGFSGGSSGGGGASGSW